MWRDRQNGEGMRGDKRSPDAGRERHAARRTRIQDRAGIQSRAAGREGRPSRRASPRSCSATRSVGPSATPIISPSSRSSRTPPRTTLACKRSSKRPSPVPFSKPSNSREPIMNIQTNHWRMARRTFLKGLGAMRRAALARSDERRTRSRSPPPVRWRPEKSRAARCSPIGDSGVEITGFTPPDTGKNYTLTPSLAPLAPFKDDLHRDDGPHVLHRRPRLVLLPAHRRQHRRATRRRSCRSISSLAAHHGSATRFPSLVLGTVRETGFGGPFPTTLVVEQEPHARSRPRIGPRCSSKNSSAARTTRPWRRPSRRMAQRGQPARFDQGTSRGAPAPGGHGRPRTAGSILHVHPRPRGTDQGRGANGSTARSPRSPRPDFGQGSPRDRIASDGRGYSEYTRHDVRHDRARLPDRQHARGESHPAHRRRRSADATAT